MNQLLKDNYQAVVDRGLITEKTTDLDFYLKAVEELSEIKQTFKISDCNIRPNDYTNEEIADLIYVCSNWLINRGQDPEYWLRYVLEKNKKRIKIKSK